MFWPDWPYSSVLVGLTRELYCRELVICAAARANKFFLLTLY
jgi:hypothetical protein